MAARERGAGFRIVGAVVRLPFLAGSGKFGKVTLGVPGRSGEIKHEVRAFSGDALDAIRELRAGQNVEITGTIDTEPLKDKAGKEVIVDGYKVWVERLTAKKVDVEGSSRSAAPTGENPGQVSGDRPAARGAW